VSWDVKEVQSQHSDYVDYLLRQLQAFGQSLACAAAAVPITAELYRLLWTLAAKVGRKFYHHLTSLKWEIIKLTDQDSAPPLVSFLSLV
jgi:hypothetical protein